jgi:hypothetical protein
MCICYDHDSNTRPMICGTTCYPTLLRCYSNTHSMNIDISLVSIFFSNGVFRIRILTKITQPYIYCDVFPFETARTMNTSCPLHSWYFTLNFWWLWANDWWYISVKNDNQFYKLRTFILILSHNFKPYL